MKSYINIDKKYLLLSLGPYCPARAFIVKLLGKSPYEGARISASRTGESCTAPCDAIIEHFVAFNHPSYLQPEKQMETIY